MRLLVALKLAGLGLLSLIFLANALGVIGPQQAEDDLGRLGLRPEQARLGVTAGRLLQLGAVPLLFVPSLRAYAAGALGLFLAGATAAAHRFWEEKNQKTRERQMTQLLKNLGLAGGLALAATL